ncbi:MAG TPA: DNA polymerase III subunit gamma/tau [Cellvibrionaceae bacterium]
MSYQVLARKWRPKIFREMVGQEHVLRALINALDHNRLHHAYLFTGTRGVGKTSIARILAKCLNCERGVSSEPCGVCSACKEIAEGRFVDLIEVDAASRTKVEDTRDLLDNVQYLPSRGRYKVYLIDEVHMLSSSSFNALLKTLEEPPEHVKFLLATTDPQKLPVTVLSRCLQFNLKNMSPERIVGHLGFVLGEEKIPFEDAALWQLARAADGSMRDSLSLTDQAIAFGCGKVASSDVAAMLGTIDYQLIAQVMQGLIDGDGRKLLEAVAAFAEHAPDYFGALGDLVTLLHRLAIAQALPDAVDNSFGDRQQILQFSRALTPEDVQLFYQTALIGRRDLHLNPDPRAGFEMTLLRMLAFKPQGLLDLPQAPLQFAAAAQMSQQAQEPIAQIQQATIGTAEDAASAFTRSPPEASFVEISVDHVAAAEQSAANTVVADEIAFSIDEARSTVTVEPALPSANTESTPASLEAGTAAKKSLAQALNSKLGSQLSAELGLKPAADLMYERKTRDKPAQVQASATQISATGVTLEELTPAHWVSVYQALNIRGVIQSTASNAILSGREGNQLYFLLDESRASLYEDSHRQRLADLLSDYFSQPIKVHINIGALSAEHLTPAQAGINDRAEKLEQGIASLQADPFVQQLISEFDGVLKIETVKVL